MYFIKRESDDMWLLSYKHGLNSSETPTCVWGTDFRDALPFMHISEADFIAKSIRGCNVIYKNVRRMAEC